ncbi:MAG: DUF4926 domain-containing protein [Bacteroidetes bacterium]|nr:DUF4926 domain-containing protein [Bacteroidota bacterium]
MKSKFNLLDVVALLKDIPGKKLITGQVGTVVEILAPGVFEVEFCDQKGQTIASISVMEKELLLSIMNWKLLKKSTN